MFNYFCKYIHDTLFNIIFNVRIYSLRINPNFIFLPEKEGIRRVSATGRGETVDQAAGEGGRGLGGEADVPWH